MSGIKEVNLTQLENMKLVVCGTSYDGNDYGEQQQVTARAGVETRKK